MDLSGFSIGSRTVGLGAAPLIIAEIAQAHDGSLGMAHAFIDAVADAGADAIKFQTHVASEESTLDEPFRVRFSLQDKTRYEYWKRMEFKKEQWKGLADHARERGLIFLSSPFSVRAVEMLREIGMPAWKVGSGEVRFRNLLDAMAENKAPILLSTGMSDFQEIASALDLVRQKELPFALFQCTSKYPTPLDQVGLNVIDRLRSRFHCPVGLSDHSGTVFPGLAALAKGADLLEVHVTFHKGMFGPDTVASVTIDELRLLVEAGNAFHAMSIRPVDKDAMAKELSGTKAIFARSLAPSRPLPAGSILERDSLTLKKPGTGIQESELERVLGRRVVRNLVPENLLKWEDME